MCGRCLGEFVGCATTSVSKQGQVHAETAGLYTSMCGCCLGEFVVAATAFGVSRQGKAYAEISMNPARIKYVWTLSWGVRAIVCGVSRQSKARFIFCQIPQW